LLIAQKEEAGIQLQAEEFDLMAAAADLDEIEEVNANCILMANLQQASTSEAAKFVGDFKSLAKEADESVAKHKVLELEVERLLRAVVSQDIISVVKNNFVGETSNLQTELERTCFLKVCRMLFYCFPTLFHTSILRDNVIIILWYLLIRLNHRLKRCQSEYPRLMLAYNQKEVDELKAKRLAKTQDPLALTANSNNPYAFAAPHQDQSSFNQNYLQQPMPNPEDITDPTTAINIALALMAKAFKLNYSTPTNNNQRISLNPRNRQIAQPGMNMGQDRQMQMVGGNVGNQNRYGVTTAKDWVILLEIA
nr:hypothetical protein [Tanacetum cinerariifolium]